MNDLISRQAAIDEIARWIGYIDEDMILRIQTGLKKLPSAEQRGRWKFNIDDKGWSWDEPYVCDQCGKWNGIETPYCPHCGAKMDGEEG